MRKSVLTITKDILLILVCVALLAAVVNSVAVTRQPLLSENRNIKVVLDESIVRGDESKIYDFYDKIIGDRKLTYLIVSTAILNDIPINYFVALCYTESRFNVNAVGKNINKEGVITSYDYGLFQLNSITFADYTKAYLMMPENNIRLAAQHLRMKYEKYKNWYEAIICYNAGNTEVVYNTSVKHFISVLTKNDELTAKFESEF